MFSWTLQQFRLLLATLPTWILIDIHVNMVMAWLSTNTLVSDQRCCSTLGPVMTWNVLDGWPSASGM